MIEVYNALSKVKADSKKNFLLCINEDLSAEEICIAISNLMKEKDPNYIDKYMDSEINACYVISIEDN